MHRHTMRKAAALAIGGLMATAAAAHVIWKQRNEPGAWTVALYHCDEEDVAVGSALADAAGDGSLDLIVGEPGDAPLESTFDVPREFLVRAVQINSAQTLAAAGDAAHPEGDMSIEFWCRFLGAGADVQVGFPDGVSLRMRIGGNGDRFQLFGANHNDPESGAYSAPGFNSFPPVDDWHHYGVTLFAPNVEVLENGRRRYGEGCKARFFFDSHIVGFADNQTLDLAGLEFEPFAPPAVTAREGGLMLDEIMISRVDWSDPVGHGGSGHGGLRLTHGFEDGRVPVSVPGWSWYESPRGFMGDK